MFRYNRPIIDSHVHIRGYSHNNIKDLLAVNHEIRRKLSLESVCVASLQAYGPDSLSQNALCVLFKILDPDSYAYAGLDHFHSGSDCSAEGYLRQVETLMEIGFDGLKFIEYKPTCRKLLEAGFNDERFARCFAYLEKNRVPILWHVADPEENWDAALCSRETVENGWCYADGTYMSKEELYAEVEAVLDRFPALNIVFAHLYYLSADPQRLDRFFERHPGVRVDITPGPSMYYRFSRCREEWRAFFIKHCNRILFGTDNGWDDISNAQNVVEGCSQVVMLDGFFSTGQPVMAWNGTLIRGLDLPDDVLDCLYRNNFMEMREGRPPKKVNFTLAAEYADSLLTADVPDVCAEAKEQLRQAAHLLREIAKT